MSSQILDQDSIMVSYNQGVYCPAGKFSLVQTFAKMPPEAPKEIFTVLIFMTKALCRAIPTGLLKLSEVLIFAVVGSAAKSRKFASFTR